MGLPVVDLLDNAASCALLEPHGQAHKQDPEALNLLPQLPVLSRFIISCWRCHLAIASRLAGWASGGSSWLRIGWVGVSRGPGGDGGVGMTRGPGGNRGVGVSYRLPRGD